MNVKRALGLEQSYPDKEKETTIVLRFSLDIIAGSACAVNAVMLCFLGQRHLFTGPLALGTCASLLRADAYYDTVVLGFL